MFIQENACDNVLCKVLSILFRSQCFDTDACHCMASPATMRFLLEQDGANHMGSNFKRIFIRFFNFYKIIFEYRSMEYH